ncbi:unnamed protein product [Prorocentrum cordatum]|uniref:Uncharacterized protein n=1 Tax=Prorocentrum cordatum TaxID=2364126 RepID=A0ABN9WQN7_9DINO|nr:unnamed protein product [Polarella glacialis]
MGGGLQREGSTVHGDIQGPLCTTAEQPSALGAVTQATALAPKASQAKADVASDADELRGIGHADADLASIMKVVSTTTTSTIRDPAQKLASEASPREASSITSSSGTRANSRCCRSGSGIETGQEEGRADRPITEPQTANRSHRDVTSGGAALVYSSTQELRNVNRAMPLWQP